MKKTRSIRRRNTSKIFIFIIIILLFFGVSKLIRQIDFFNLKKINITGNKNLKKEFILEGSKVHMGQNIFDINLLKVKNRLKNNPYIKEIKVSRKLPDIINIDIVEKEEIFQMLQSDKKYIVLDEDGIILNIVNNPTKDATIVKGVKFKQKINKDSIGKNIVKFIKYKRAEEFFRTNGQIKLSKRLKEIVINEDHMIRMVLKNNKVIEFGSLKNSSYKLRLLNETLDYINREKISFEKILMDRGENPIIVMDREPINEGG